MKIANLSFLCMALLVTGCDVGSKYEPPSTDCYQGWKNETATSSDAYYTDYWWEVFNDPLLDDLEEQAIANNNNLLLAYNRVQASRALMEVAEADLYPQLFLNPVYNNQGVLYESYTTHEIVRAHEMLFFLPLNLSYEVDLWGKIHDIYEAAREDWEAEIEAYNSVMLILTTELASVFYQLRTMDLQIDLLTATIKAREKAFHIYQARYESQINDYYETTLAGVELNNAIAEYQEIVRIRAELENCLAVLLGTSASDFCFEHYPLDGIPPIIPVGIPSEVLLRRPDVAEAERMMASEHSLVNAAFASFFPSLSLTAAAGFSSPHLRYFLKNRGRYWQYGANASQMVFDGGRLSADLALQEYRFNEASDAYQQTVLECLAEVEDALSNIQNYTKEFDDISNSVEWAKRTFKIASNRYENGVSSYLDVAISEDKELASEVAQNNLLGLRFVSTIQLIKAIGGGW